MTAPATQPLTKSAGVTTVPGVTIAPQPTRKLNAATPTSGTGAQPAVTVIVPTSTSAPPATATVASPTRTPTIAATATRAATATGTTTLVSGAGDGSSTTLTANGSVTSSRSIWWGEEDLSLAIQKPLTALRIVVTVQKTPGINYAGAYTTFLGGAMTMDHADTGTTVIYTYTLNPSQTISPGTGYVIGSQHGGNGTDHSTTGDTYTVNATANGITITLAGHF